MYEDEGTQEFSGLFSFCIKVFVSERPDFCVKSFFLRETGCYALRHIFSSNVL